MLTIMAEFIEAAERRSELHRTVSPSLPASPQISCRVAFVDAAQRLPDQEFAENRCLRYEMVAMTAEPAQAVDAFFARCETREVVRLEKEHQAGAFLQ